MEPAMKERRSPCLPILLLILFAALCLIAFLAGRAVLMIPGRAAQLFGPVSPHLEPFQRIYLATMLLQDQAKLLEPTNPFGEERLFTVELGESVPSITNRLVSEELISGAEAFRNYLTYAGLDKTIQAGDYLLSPSMTPVEIANTMQDATPTVITYHVLAGWRLEEIAANLPFSGLDIEPQDFLEAASQPPSGSPLNQIFPPSANLEGFLLPGSYQVRRGTSADDFVLILLQAFDEQVDNELRQGFERHGLSLFQAVILASIVERESVIEDEMPIITSVFYNRLAAGLKLDTDPSVQYAIGYNPAQKTWWTNPLSRTDLQFDSPYNTYLYPGLPPGPIANPGLAALRAVAFPAQTPYYYFRATCDQSGRHNFSETYEQHLQKDCP
jgi:UPF0755 protein